MRKKKSKDPLIPFPSIEIGDKSYYFSEIVKWIFKFEVSANDRDIDLVRIYDQFYRIGFHTTLNLKNEFEFESIIDSEPDMNIIKITDSLRTFEITKISCHSKIVFSLVELLPQNIHEFILEAAKYLQLPHIHTHEGHRGELGIIDLLITKLRKLLGDDKFQLIPSLFYHRKETKLYYLDNYPPPIGTILGEPICMSYTYEYLFSKRTSDIFNEKLLELIEERQQLLNKIFTINKDRPGPNNKNLTMDDMFYSDAIKEFNKVEESFIKNEYIVVKDNGTMVWLKSIQDLIGLIYILLDFGYLKSDTFENSRVGCRRFFEMRYNKKIRQSFEEGRIEKKLLLFKQYKNYPVYNNVKPL